MRGFMPLFLIFKKPLNSQKSYNENFETKVIHWQTVLKKLE